MMKSTISMLLDGTMTAKQVLETVISEFPEQLLGVKDCEQHNPHHQYDLYGHTVKTVENALSIKLPNESARFCVVLAALLHDIGKPIVKMEKDHKRLGLVDVFYKHPAESAKLARAILEKDQSLSEEEIDLVIFLVKNHEAFISFKLLDEFVEGSGAIPITKDSVMKVVQKGGTVKEWALVTYLMECDSKAQALIVHDKDGNIFDTQERKLERCHAIRALLK